MSVSTEHDENNMCMDIVDLVSSEATTTTNYDSKLYYSSSTILVSLGPEATNATTETWTR